jgi:tetratricopeptide (TPR) repeat protein
MTTSAIATDVRLEEAERSYRHAVFAGDPSRIEQAERGLDALEADTALARGRLRHARYLADRGTEDPAELDLFERASHLHGRLGDERGEGEAQFWIGIVHQVIRGDQTTAAPFFERALELSTSAGDDLTRSYALRHLAVVAQEAGDLSGARSRLEESTQLRRDLGFHAGAAANLIGLAHLAAAEERSADVRRILDEARALADRPEAAGVLTWVEAAREELRRFL